MHKFFSIVKNELYRYFTSPTAYVYLLAFLFLNASFTLYLGHFIERGDATLDVMFGYQPWIYLIFVSGIAMRLWAEEFKNKTIYQIMALPVGTFQFVWGKFVAAWLFCSLALFLTFTFVITVNILGEPNNSIIATAYLGSFLLSGAMLAVAQTMSTLSKNQVVALVLSVVVNLLFFLSGIEYVLGFYRSFLPYELVENIADLSFLTQFMNMANGVVALSGILFFISTICLFNFLSEIIIRVKTSGISPILKNNNKFGFVLIAVLAWMGFAGFNLICNHIFYSAQLDVSNGRIYTVPDAAKSVLENIKEPVSIKIYYSKILSQRNPLFRQAFDNLNILMKAYQRLAKGKLSYRFYYPELLNDDEDMALHEGIKAISIPDLNQNAFFGITINDEAGNTKVIPFLPLENQNKFGQEIIQNIYELSNNKSTIGLISSLELLGVNDDENVANNPWEIIEEIKKLYRIKPITTPTDISNIDVLLIVHPQNLDKDLVQSITKYTLNGGKILILADVAAEAQRLYSPMNQRLTPSDFEGLNKLWGFEFNHNIVVADLDNSITVNTGNKKNASFTQDVLQFMIKNDAINNGEEETSNLTNILMASASEITPVKNHNSTFIPLLYSSNNSALFPSTVVYENLNPADLLAQFKPDNVSKVLAAKIISNDKRHPFEVIVIGDSDFAYDAFWNKFRTIEDMKYLLSLNDNANFILNALDSLSGNTELIGVRNTIISHPKFEQWEKTRKQNLQKLAQQEQIILESITKVKTQLNDLWRKKNFEERQDFSDDELAIIAQFRKALKDLKLRLSNMKNDVNYNIKEKQNLVVFFNLYAIPLLIILMLLFFNIKNTNKAKHCPTLQPIWNKALGILTFGVLLLFIGGISLSLWSFNYGNEFEKRLVFPDWKEQLNKIEVIKIENNKQTLNLYKSDGFWSVEGLEEYPVYQRRIINFLAVLANARYLEKKSARAEYLPKFGLNKENMTTIRLEDKNKNNILQFDIGKYDEEIGRGGRGAYLKFPNKFQAWLIEADFISLSPDWREWTMNTALNIRFGRILNSDITDDIDILIILIKELLNTPLSIVAQEPDNLEIENKILLNFENGDNFIIYFEKANDKNYIRYKFGNTEGKYLQLFAKHAKDKLYEIPEKNMEKIRDVFEAIKP